MKNEKEEEEKRRSNLHWCVDKINQRCHFDYTLNNVLGAGVLGCGCGCVSKGVCVGGRGALSLSVSGRYGIISLSLSLSGRCGTLSLSFSISARSLGGVELWVGSDALK